MSLNVLVVDDSSVTRAMIIKTLRMAGVPLGEIYQAGDGREGLAVLQEQWNKTKKTNQLFCDYTTKHRAEQFGALKKKALEVTRATPEREPGEEG